MEAMNLATQTDVHLLELVLENLKDIVDSDRANTSEEDAKTAQVVIDKALSAGFVHDADMYFLGDGVVIDDQTVKDLLESGLGVLARAVDRYKGYMLMEPLRTAKRTLDESHTTSPTPERAGYPSGIPRPRPPWSSLERWGARRNDSLPDWARDMWR